MKVSFIIDGEPVPWARARRRGKQYFIDDKQKRAREDIAWKARMAWRIPPYDGPIFLEVVAHYSLPKKLKKHAPFFKISRPDADNLAKLIMDACKNIMWHDDAQVAEVLVSKRYTTGNPYTAVTIEAITYGHSPHMGQKKHPKGKEE